MPFHYGFDEVIRFGLKRTCAKKSRFPLLPKEQILASKRSSEAGSSAEYALRRRLSHEDNGSHRFEVGGSVGSGVGAGSGGMGTVGHAGIEFEPGKYARRPDTFEHEFRWRNAAGHACGSDDTFEHDFQRWSAAIQARGSAGSR